MTSPIPTFNHHQVSLQNPANNAPSYCIDQVDEPNGKRPSVSFNNSITKIQKTSGTFSNEPSKTWDLSRSKLELFLSCSQCFYDQYVHGIARPPSFPLNLNNSVDLMLKNEFDAFRSSKKPHTLIMKMLKEKFGIRAIPYNHPKLNEWRNSYEGVSYVDKELNLRIFAAIDDLWVNQDELEADFGTPEVYVVDYKSTYSNYEISSLDKPWHSTYKRQLEFYSWVLRKNGLKVSESAFILYINADPLSSSIKKGVQVKATLIEHKCDLSWVEKEIQNAHNILTGKVSPISSSNCAYCHYAEEKKKLHPL